MTRRYNSGDTIIEVVLAFAIFTVAAISAIALINSGLATTQRNLEITLVRQQIDSQAELLRNLRDTQDPLWRTIIDDTDDIVDNPTALDGSCRTVTAGDRAFYIQPAIDSTNPENTSFTRVSLMSVARPDIYARINYDDSGAAPQGIWIQVARAQNSGTVNTYDFYIHACWDSVGTSVPVTLGTIVRIYD